MPAADSFQAPVIGKVKTWRKNALKPTSQPLTSSNKKIYSLMAERVPKILFMNSNSQMALLC